MLWWFFEGRWSQEEHKVPLDKYLMLSYWFDFPVECYQKHSEGTRGFESCSNRVVFNQRSAPLINTLLGILFSNDKCLCLGTGDEGLISIVNSRLISLWQPPRQVFQYFLNWNPHMYFLNWNPQNHLTSEAHDRKRSQRSTHVKARAVGSWVSQPGCRASESIL